MIYFDNAATTRPSVDALQFAQKFNTELYFNPSALYKCGLSCMKEIRSSKEKILKCLGANSHEIIFTSCGTESNNLAIFGAVKRGVYVTDKGEHASVFKCFLEKRNDGEKVEFINLNKDGSVNCNLLYDYVQNNRVDFVSIMHVNNETGAINDINAISKKLKEINPKILFHSDGVQAFGKIPYKIADTVDYYSISAHKINGLKGTGALIKRKNAKLSPFLFGGGQENGLRSGTENIFGIKVFEAVTDSHFKNLYENFNEVNKLKNFIVDNLNKENFAIISGQNSSPYILSISACGLRGEVVMHMLENSEIYVGNGSACSSKNRFSRVIESCGYGNDVLDGVIRISFSPENTLSEAKILVDELNSAVEKLKGIMIK